MARRFVALFLARGHRNAGIHRHAVEDPGARTNRATSVNLGRDIVEIEAIDARVKNLVEECEKFAEESPFPEVQQLYDVVYEQENYPFIPHRL